LGNVTLGVSVPSECFFIKLIRLVAWRRYVMLVVYKRTWRPTRPVRLVNSQYHILVMGSMAENFDRISIRFDIDSDPRNLLLGASHL